MVNKKFWLKKHSKFKEIFKFVETFNLKVKTNDLLSTEIQRADNSLSLTLILRLALGRAK